MELKISKTTIGLRPNVPMPNRELLKHVGESRIRRMVSDHYDLLVQSSIKHLFPDNPQGLNKAKLHSADFMVQILGGPTYYNESRGKPRMVDSHNRFAITPEAREVWLECYREALLKLEAPEPLIVSFWNYLNIFSMWMINTEETK
jgi:hemoglobin